MAPKPTLTKSLHTVTAVANVARELIALSGGKTGDAHALTTRALAVLGYDIHSFAKSDETVIRCLAAVAKVLQS